MYLNEILELDKTTASIKKIDLFLAGCKKKNSDYYKALSYRNIVLHSLGKTNEALKALYSLVIDFNKLDDASVIAICDGIIKITLDTNILDQSRKYIDIKKQHLKISNEYLGYMDEINYTIAKKEYLVAIELLTKYLNDEINSEDTCWTYEKFALVYYKINDFNRFLEVAEKLEKIYKETLNTKKLIDLLYIKLEIAFNQGKYIQVIIDANRLLNDYDLEVEITIKVTTLLISSYIKSKDYRKASIIESNYEEKLNEVTSQTALAFCKASLELYTHNNSVVSIKHYQDRIIEFSQTEKKTKNIRKNNYKNIVIPPVEVLENKNLPLDKKDVSDDFLDIIAKPVKTIYVSKNYEQLRGLYSIINNLDSDFKFREIFRQALIELTKIIGFNEAYLVYYNSKYNGLHYKKERVYDKRLDFDSLDDTINFLAITKEQEIYLDEESTIGLKNILTKELYEEKPFAISIPLFKEGLAYASIAFFSSNTFLDEDLAYETLKLVSEMLNRSLIFELKQNEIVSNNKKMFFIYENMSSGIKELLNGNIHLSQQAKTILGGLEDMSFTDFKYHIHTSDVHKYQAMVDDVFKQLSLNKYIIYRYKKGGEYIWVKETFFPSLENDNILIYSLIEDYTLIYQKENELTNLAFINPTTKLQTELKLLLDLKASLNNLKLSLAIADIADFKLYEELYGINFANQLILAIANELTKAFENNFEVSLYHLGFDRYAILLKNTNDKRTVDSELNKIFTTVQTKINMLNDRVKLHFNCGVYRASKSSNIHEESKILVYAFDALNDAKSLNSLENHICHYDSELAKMRFNTNQLVTHISESIDHGRLGISYKQVVNIKSNEIYAYYANISLDNFEVDYSYMQSVIKRRKLEELLDKYVISNVSKELRMLKEKAKTNLKVIVPLDAETQNKELPGFIETQNTFFKTTKKDVIFLVKDASNLIIRTIKNNGYLVASKSLMDLYQGFIDYYVYDVSVNGFNSLDEIVKLCKDKDIILLASGINDKSDIERILALGIDYIYGNYYKKSIRMKKVIDNIA